MSKKSLRLLPINFAKDGWAYEDINGISIFVERGKDISPYVGVIPLRTIRGYLRHIDKKEGDKKQ
jgi:hypothetical protein